MLIDNVLSLIEEYTAYKQLPRMERFKRVIAAPTIANSQQRDGIKKAVKQDGVSLATRTIDTAVPGLGTGISLGTAAINIARNPTKKNSIDAISDTLSDEISPLPIKTASSIIDLKQKNARAQYLLDFFKSKSEYSDLHQSRMQKICANNPGLKGC